MAHHVHALLLAEGQSARAALEAALRREEEAEGEPLDPGREARKRSIASSLAHSRLGYDVLEHEYDEIAEEQNRTEDQIRRELRHVHVDNGCVHVDIDEHHVTLSIPYSDELDPGQVAETTFDTLRILREEAKLVPFDPQLDRELDLDRDLVEFADAYRHGVEEARAAGRSEAAAEPQRRAWWQRLILRRGR